MLAKVDALSRPTPVGFQLLKIEGPKGELVPGIGAYWLLWGMEPARRRERRVELLEGFSCRSGLGEGDLKGL
jgi:hypothetical protein